MENKASIICLGHDENALLFNANGIKGVVVNSNNIIKKIESFMKKVLIYF